jgi:hypothetical protein
MRVVAQMVAEIRQVVNFSTITFCAGGQLLGFSRTLREGGLGMYVL